MTPDVDITWHEVAGLFVIPSVESTKTGKRSASNFFLSNRVEMVPREPQKGERNLRPCNHGEVAPGRPRTPGEHGAA